MLFGKALGAFSYEVNVRALAQHLPRGADGIGNVLNAAHSPGAEGVAIHNESIELNLAFAVQKTATASVEGFVVFHHHNCGFDCIKRRASTLKQVPPGSHGLAHAI